MANVDVFVLLCQGIVLFVYGAVLIGGCVFTFCIDEYLRFEEKFIDVDTLSRSLINPMNRNMRALYEWCVFNHTAIGLLLIGSALWVLISLMKAIAGL